MPSMTAVRSVRVVPCMCAGVLNVARVRGVVRWRVVPGVRCVLGVISVVVVRRSMSDDRIGDLRMVSLCVHLKPSMGTLKALNNHQYNADTCTTTEQISLDSVGQMA
jgi:hypothetical protein